MNNAPKAPVCMTTMLYAVKPEKVNHKTGVISGAAVVTEGEAQGHGFMLDESFVSDVVRLGNAAENGVKVRFGHPSMSETALGTFLGRAKNFRVDGNLARADLFLSQSAKEAPQGNLYEYVLKLAETDPEAFGLSIVFEAGESYRKPDADGKVQDDSPEYATLKRLRGVDMVDDPAANPDGLFSAFSKATWAGQVSEFLDTHPHIYQLAAENREVVDSFLERYTEFVARKEAASSGMEEEGEIDMAEPATLKELKAAYPDHPEFVLEQLEKESTVEQAQSEFQAMRIEELEAQVAELTAKCEEAEGKAQQAEAELSSAKESVEVAKPSKEGLAEYQESQPEFSTIDEAAVAFQKKTGCELSDAYIEMSSRYPELAEAALKAGK